MKMQFEKLDAGVLKVILAGRLDIIGAQEIDSHFCVAVAAHLKVIVDLERVDFLASMGIRTLIVGAKAMRSNGGRMVLLRPTADVEKVLVGSGADTVIPIAHDMGAALTALHG